MTSRGREAESGDSSRLILADEEWVGVKNTKSAVADTDAHLVTLETIASPTRCAAESGSSGYAWKRFHISLSQSPT